MHKQVLTSLLILNSIVAFSQVDLLDGYVITETQDTIYGKLVNKDYYRAKKITLYVDQNQSSFQKKNLKTISFNNIIYIKSDYDIWTTAFFRKDITGHVNLYRYRNSKFLGVYDTDLNFGGLKPSLKYFCDDYPNLNNNFSQINKNSLDSFLIQYNQWKENNTNSRSYYENNIHKKKLLNFKLSYLLPGIGLEIGLNEHLAFNSLLKIEFGYGNQQGFIMNPLIDSQLRYYHNIDSRKEQNKRTYKYSGNYFCLVNIYDIEIKEFILGLEYGWQRTIGKNWYYNFGFGAGKWLGIDALAIICDFDFGHNF